MTDALATLVGKLATQATETGDPPATLAEQVDYSIFADEERAHTTRSWRHSGVAEFAVGAEVVARGVMP